MNKSVKHKGNFKISIVIPVLNEEYNVRNLGFEILKSLEQITHEIIFVDDGSSDNTKNEIIKLSKEINNLRLIVHDKRRGQSVAMRSGILSSKFDVIGTIDGDGQNNPQDFVTLIETFKNNNSKFLLVAGERVNRKDKLNKRIASNIAKLIRKSVLGDIHSDSGCGIRVFNKELFLRIPFFNHMHRFFPSLAIREGSKVLSVPVSHRKRETGISKYTNIGRAFAGFFDLIGVIWLLKRSAKDIDFYEYNFKTKEKK